MTAQVAAETKATSSEFIQCAICGANVHSVEHHLKRTHPEVSIDDYRSAYPSHPLLSPTAIEAISRAAKNGAATKASARANAAVTGGYVTKAMHELFKLGADRAALSGAGNPIPIKVLDNGDFSEMVPELDPNYVYEIENLKNALLALEFNIPLLVWGHAGTGKTTLIEQIAHRTNRPMLRVQHTVGTEESNVVGQWVVRNKETVFDLGPLPLAMKHGWIYLADEYDFAHPSVLAVYQPILEGKPLVIKEADAENRIIKPHPNFRFVATGNTNGSGDEHGIYQGTQIQNAANYDRFNVVIKAEYMEKSLESKILMGQVGIMKSDADKFVDFATRVREEFSASKISLPISPRTLIRSAQLGMIKGNYKQGLTLAFTNKLSKEDKQVVDGLAQRIFG